jgi:hypothetical protein
VPTRIVASQETDDLAVLKLDGAVTAAATLRVSPSPRNGEAIVIYGFPLSGLLASTGHVSVGHVTALAGLRDDPRQLQISTSVEQGNSGGPVLDMSGNVVGVAVSKLDALRLAGLADDIPHDVSFAVLAHPLRLLRTRHQRPRRRRAAEQRDELAPSLIDWHRDPCQPSRRISNWQGSVSGWASYFTPSRSSRVHRRVRGMPIIPRQSDRGPTKLEHQAAVEIEPENVRFRFTHRVSHDCPRSDNIRH